MKKKSLFVIGIVTFLALTLIFSVGIDRLFNRLRGTVSVTVNNEEYPVERVECRYEDGSTERVTYGIMTSEAITVFKNRGNRYGMYEYSFFISLDDINVEPKIRLFKTNWYRANKIDIDIKIFEDNGVWNADVSVETKLTTYQETFYDIEYNGIEMRVE